MEIDTPKPGKVAFKWAIIYVITSIVITYAFQLLNIDQNGPAKYLGYIPFIAFLFLAQKEYKDQLGSYLTFNQGFMSGFLYAVFGGIMIGVFVFIYLQFLSPQMMDQALATQQEKMAAQGLSDEQMKQSMEIAKKFGPIIGAVFTIIILPIVGALLALIGAAIFKKEKPMFTDDAVA